MKCILAAFSFAILLTGATPAVAAPPRPLSNILSFSDFKELLLHNAARVPELIELWRKSKEPGQPQFFWGGGTLRGFLHWHYVQLQSHSPAKLRVAKLPTLDELQPPGGWDVDIIGPKTAQILIDQAMPDFDIDSYDLENFWEMVALGGPTLEKVILNPTKIVDPLDGLLHYYQGRLVFNSVPDKQFRALPLVTSPESRYSKTVEGLRYIRMLQTYPELEADPESQNRIRAIAKSEMRFISSPLRQEWVVDTLKKLSESLGEDGNLVVRRLRDFNMLDILHQNHIYVRTNLGRLDLAGLTANERLAAVAVVRPTTIGRAVRDRLSALYHRICERMAIGQ